MILYCGNARTFLDCFENSIEKLVCKLFNSDKYNIYIYLYLKMKDMGPKGQAGWNFSYNDIDINLMESKIKNYIVKYGNYRFIYKLINTNEIEDDVIYSQVLNKNLYNKNLFFNNMMRALHCHYNFEICGKRIQEIEKEKNVIFSYIVYVRPDLFFTSEANSIDKYNVNLVTLGEGPAGPKDGNIDHLAIIPRRHFTDFFFNRMNLYRNNNTKFYNIPEEIYKSTIQCEIKYIARYNIIWIYIYFFTCLLIKSLTNILFDLLCNRLKFFGNSKIIVNFTRSDNIFQVMTSQKK